MIENSGDEISKFKKEISLTVYAASLGYVKDDRESWKTADVMRGPGDDKIIVATAENGHGIYYSIRDSRDHGTIVDLVQKRKGLNLGQVRKELRSWIGIGAKPPKVNPAFRKPVPTTRDHQGVLWRWQRARVLDDYRYLNSRGLIRADLAAVRIDDITKMDERGNVLFGHYDQDGLCGYEIKNKGFTSFAKGGSKGLWIAGQSTGDVRRTVICETAIDALSYAKLHRDNWAVYLSFGGSWNPEQPGLLKTWFDRYFGAEIIAAVDNDEAGDKFAIALEALAPGRVRRHSPEVRGEDWNDVLMDRLGLGQGMERSTERCRQGRGQSALLLG